MGFGLEMYSRSQKNSDASVPVRPVQTPLHCSCQPLVIGRGLSTCKKRKASTLTRRLESIVSYCYGLLNCSGAVHYCRSSILSEFCDRGSTRFEVCYRRLIDLALPIDSDCLQMRSLV